MVANSPLLDPFLTTSSPTLFGPMKREKGLLFWRNRRAKNKNKSHHVSYPYPTPVDPFLCRVLFRRRYFRFYTVDLRDRGCHRLRQSAEKKGEEVRADVKSEAKALKIVCHADLKGKAAGRTFKFA